MATSGADRVFLRKASGLIKTASVSDVFIYDIGLVSIGRYQASRSAAIEALIRAPRRRRKVWPPAHLVTPETHR